MPYNEKNPLVEFIKSLFGLLVFVWIVSNVGKIGFWFAAGIVLLIYAVLFLISYIAEKFQRWRARRRPCVHGIRSGKDGACPACALDELKRKLEAKANQAEQERKKEIRGRADDLHHSELASLRKRWLSRSELYFQMNPREFENAIAQLFRELGFEVKQTPFSNDRGKDAIVWKNGEKYLVECKRYEADNKIGRRDLQIFFAAMKEENAKAGYYINTGSFASTAIAYAKENQIELYDRRRLPTLVNSAYPDRGEIQTASVMCLECGAIEALAIAESSSAGICPNGHEMTNKITTRLVCMGAFASATQCERCGSDLKLVNGRYRKFWGCTKYPKCKFMKRYRE